MSIDRAMLVFPFTEIEGSAMELLQANDVMSFDKRAENTVLVIVTQRFVHRQLVLAPARA